MKKIIFLDIDGVLNCNNTVETCNGLTGIDPKLAKNLVNILDATDASIVVSSSWRKNMSELEAALWQNCPSSAERILKAICGSTPEDPHGFRGKEIGMWLEHYTANGYAVSFVILDDGDDMGKLFPFLVKTDSAFGLTAEISNKVIQRLAE